jgi:hypothetical protein
LKLSSLGRVAKAQMSTTLSGPTMFAIVAQDADKDANFIESRALGVLKSALMMQSFLPTLSCGTDN